MKNNLIFLVLPVFIFYAACSNVTDLDDSNSSTSTTTTTTIGQIETPIIIPGTGTYTTPQNVDIQCATEGVTIYYTLDSTDPTISVTRQVFSGSVLIDESKQLRAFASKFGMIDSAEANATYTITGSYDQPTFDPPAGLYHTNLTVSLSALSNATIYYTTNGDPATTNGIEYTAPIEISRNMTINAIAADEGWESSAEASASFILQPNAPSLNLASGTYQTNQNLEMTSQSGTTIYYTTNGTEPNTNSTIYSDLIDIDRCMTIKALAYKQGWSNSIVLTNNYLLQASAPSYDYSSGIYSSPISMI